MLIGGDDISNDVMTIGTCFFMFVYIRARFLRADWRGATGEVKVEFKFQRRSCKLSFLFSPRRQSAPESLIVGYSYPKDSAFTAVKRDAKFLSRFVKGVPFVNRKYTKGLPFLSNMVHKRVRSWSSGRNLPV